MSDKDERIPEDMLPALFKGLIADAERRLGRRLLDVEIETAFAKVGIKAKVTKKEKD